MTITEIWNIFLTKLGLGPSDGERVIASNNISLNNSYLLTNQLQASIRDEGEIWTSSKLTTLFPNAYQMQEVLGSCGVYVYFNKTWRYTPYKLSSVFIGTNRTIPSINGHIYFVDATSGNITLTLPPASASIVGFETTIVRIDNSANTLSVVRSGTNTINNALTSFTILTTEVAKLFCLSESSFIATKSTKY